MVDIRNNQNEEAVPEINIFQHQVKVDTSNMAQVAMALYTVYYHNNVKSGFPQLFVPELHTQFNQIASGVSDSLFFILATREQQLNG